MTDIGLISEDKEGERNPSEQREETVVSRKELIRAKEPNRAEQRNPSEQRKKPISIITEKQSVHINT